MKPKHVENFYENITYREYSEEEKKLGMNEKDMDFMTKNPMYYMVFLPSVAVIGAGLLPWIAILIHRLPMFQIM